nr:MAG TPA: hypothetical protein [Caudoviricetes sp.]
MGCFYYAIKHGLASGIRYSRTGFKRKGEP